MKNSGWNISSVTEIVEALDGKVGEVYWNGGENGDVMNIVGGVGAKEGESDGEYSSSFTSESTVYATSTTLTGLVANASDGTSALSAAARPSSWFSVGVSITLVWLLWYC